MLTIDEKQEMARILLSTVTPPKVLDADGKCTSDLYSIEDYYGVGLMPRKVNGKIDVIVFYDYITGKGRSASARVVTADTDEEAIQYYFILKSLAKDKTESTEFTGGIDALKALATSKLTSPWAKP